MPSWTERPVDRELPHFVLTHEDHASPVLLLGPAVDGMFGVEFLVRRETDDGAMQRLVREVVRSLDFYLDAGGPDPWSYAIYHCGTAANMHAPVHWAYSEPPGGAEGDDV